MQQLGERRDSRDKSLDVMKGIGIILMVAGHSGSPFTSIIYLFHMALFFAISGYLWNDRNAESVKSLLLYGKRKMSSLYVPFVAITIVFILLHNVFLHIGIYTEVPLFLELMPSAHDKLITPYSIEEMLIKAIKAILFSCNEQLGGALWFLRTLFLISIGHAVSKYIVLHWRYGRIYEKITVFILTAALLLIVHCKVQLPNEIVRCCIAYAAYLLGTVYKCAEKKLLDCRTMRIWGVSGAVVLLLLNQIGTIEIVTGEITSLLFFILATTAGWGVIRLLAKTMKGVLLGVVAYIGERSLWVVMLHFLSFKTVSLVYILVTKQDYLWLAKFPTMQVEPYLWIPYLLVGVILPLVFEYGWSQVTSLLKSRS